MTDQGTTAGRDRHGRVHLTVVRDAQTGEESVTLDGPLFNEAWQNRIAAGAANSAHAGCGGGASLAGVVAVARDLMAATSRLGEALLARAPAGAVACRAGCNHCCHQSVGVTAPEALAIFDHLSRALSDAQLAALAAHVANRRAETRGLTAAQRFSPAHPCIFLRAGQCTIYDVRPLSCRGMNALDEADCARRLRDPDARAAFVAAGLGGHAFLEPIRAVHAVSAGLQLALSELHGLDMRPLDLIGAMDLLLNDAEEIPDAWIAGGTPLEPARLQGDPEANGLGTLGGRISPRR